MQPATALTLTLKSIARLERSGMRPPRLTEASHEKWARIRRRHCWIEFIRLLHEDLADAFPVPFDLGRWASNPLADLGEETAESLVNACTHPDESDPGAFLRAAARDLDLPAGGAFSDLPRTAPNQKILELPGSAGRIAAMQVSTLPGLAFHAQFVFVADNDVERLLVGLSAVECRSNEPTIWTSDKALTAIREGARFDRAVGVRGWPAAERLATGLALETRWA
jgi:hypothetical protein